ncbi:MAG: hypothetical protein WCX63_06730 [Methanoregula sp.]
MDTGKIMMGTALLLIMVGLLVHPAGATEPGDIPLVGQEAITGGTGSAPDCGYLYCITGTGFSKSATHPYERLTIIPSTSTL